MRKGPLRQDNLGTSASSSDNADLSSETNFPNLRVASYKRFHELRKRFEPSLYVDETRPKLKVTKTKLPYRKSTFNFGKIQHTSSLHRLPLRNRPEKNEHQVTFVEAKYCSGEGPCRIFVRKLRKDTHFCANSDTVPLKEEKLSYNEERVLTPLHPQDSNSKSSFVVLYQGKSLVSPPLSPKPLIRPAKSEHTIVNTPLLPPETKSITEYSSFRPKAVKTPENLSPSISVRRKGTRRYQRAQRKRESLNVNIFHGSQVIQVAEPVSNTTDHERQGNLSHSFVEAPKQAEDRIREKPTCHHYYPSLHSRTECCHFENAITDAKSMAHSSHSVKKDNPELPNSINFSPNLGFLMQHMTIHPRGTDNSTVDTGQDEDSKRVFPFQTTPSGNLKIIPNQVVFESKKVSVLVADPKHTKVNVKAELNRPDVNVNPTDCNPCPKQGHIDFPPGVPPSTTNRLQFQQKLLHTEHEYRPRTQPYKPNYSQMKVEELMESVPENHPPLNEVPLSSLGFTEDKPIDWGSIMLPEKTDLYQELARRITNFMNADCIVHLGRDEFHCHLLVLQSYSTFFDEENKKEIDLTESNVTSKAFCIIYDWMISTKNESCQLLRRDNILEIFVAAQYLGIKELEEQCWAFIDNDELFSEDTAFLLYLEARKIGNTAVMELMVPRIMKFFLLLVGTRDFLELSVEELCLLLRSNYICVNSEMEVLMSAVRWLMHDWESRKQYMLEVLKCVRFGLIAPWQLVDVKRNPENPEFMELMSYQEIQKMVDDGLAYVIIKYWYGKQTEDYHHWIELLGLTEPTNRNWAGEDKNYVTYREFLLYLEEYRKIKMSGLIDRKAQIKPDPPNSPPKDIPPLPPDKMRANYFASHVNGDATTIGKECTSTNNAWSLKHTSKLGPGYPTSGAQSDMAPSEVLNEYFSNPSRNDKGVNRATGDGERIGKSATFDKRLSGGGEFSNKARIANQVGRKPHEIDDNIPKEFSLIQHRHSNLVFPTQKKQHQRDLQQRQSDHADFAESKNNAATYIQAVFRGYKARRKVNEIRRTSCIRKQNTKKVAELLSCNNLRRQAEIMTVINSMTSYVKHENDRSTRTKESSNINVENRTDKTDCTSAKAENQSKLLTSENQLRLEAVSYNGCADPIEMIQYTAFDNRDDKWSFALPSKKNDMDDQLSFKSEERSAIDLHTHEVLYQNPAYRISSSNNNKAIDKKATFQNDVLCQLARKLKNIPLCHQHQKVNISLPVSKPKQYFSKHSMGFSDQTAILVFGGTDPYAEYGCTGNTGKDIYRFTPVRNAWEFVGEMPEPRYHHSVVFLKGRIYLVGGADPRNTDIRRKGNVVGTAWSFDPSTRMWFAEPNMLTPRRNFGMIASHGKIYAFGGQDKNGTALKTVEMFDPSECAWKEIQPMFEARMGHAIAKYRNLIWIAGGMTNTRKGSLLKNVECYDPVQNVWFRCEPLNKARTYFSMFVIFDCLYIVGGAGKLENETHSMATIDSWDPDTRIWKAETEMSIARYGHAVASVDDCLLVTGGVTTIGMKTLQSVECYSCERKMWLKNIAPLPYAICAHSTVSLPPICSLGNL